MERVSMPEPEVIACPACGANSAGQFCDRCGASVRTASCAKCGGALGSGALFCRHCGAAASGNRAGGGRRRRAWSMIALACVVVLGVLALVLAREAEVRNRVLAPGSAAGIDLGAAPPDISGLSPRERFDRLYDRVMRAAREGDQNGFARFAPMALLAYGQLDTVGADARYRTALLMLHVGQVDGAMRLADTLLAASPGHLLGYLVRGTAARWAKDDALVRQALADFLSHYDAEMKTGKPEYVENGAVLAAFRQTAMSAGQGEGPPGKGATGAGPSQKR